MHLDLRVGLATLCPNHSKTHIVKLNSAHFACVKINLFAWNLHLGGVGTLRHLAHKLTELVSADLLLVLRDDVGLLLLLLLLEARARILTGLVVRIRRLRRFVVNVDASCPTPPARRLFAVSRLRRLHLLLVVHPIHIRASPVVLLGGCHLLTPTASVLLLLLLSQLLLRVMHTCTGARLVTLRFEISLHLMTIVLVHHCLRVLNLLSLIELMVVVVRLARVALYLISRIVGCLIIDDVQVAALLDTSASVFELNFDFGHLPTLCLFVVLGGGVLTLVAALAIAPMQVYSV